MNIYIYICIHIYSKAISPPIRRESYGFFKTKADKGLMNFLGDGKMGDVESNGIWSVFGISGFIGPPFSS